MADLSRRFLERDVNEEIKKLQAKAKKKKKGFGFGSSLGGLLGGIAMNMIFPGAGLLGTTFGKTLGTYIGGKQGMKAGGSLEGGEFLEGTRAAMTDDFKSALDTQVQKTAINSLVMGGVMDKAKGFGKDLFAKTKIGTDAAGGATGGMMMDGKWIGSAQQPAGTKMLSGLGKGYEGLDKMLGGILPKGQAIGEGWMGKGASAIGGLLTGPGGGGTEYASMDVNNVPDATTTDVPGMPEDWHPPMTGGPEYDDPGDWETGLDGRVYSPSLGKYQDEV